MLNRPIAQLGRYYMYYTVTVSSGSSSYPSDRGSPDFTYLHYYLQDNQLTTDWLSSYPDNEVTINLLLTSQHTSLLPSRQVPTLLLPRSLAFADDDGQRRRGRSRRRLSWRIPSLFFFESSDILMLILEMHPADTNWTDCLASRARVSGGEKNERGWRLLPGTVWCRIPSFV